MAREDVVGTRDAVSAEARSPRILCWNCKKLTPFYEDRCVSCGSRFAGSTGGVYAARPASKSAAKAKSTGAAKSAPTGKPPIASKPRAVPAAASDETELAEARRTLIQLFEDLQRVHDVSSRRQYDPRTHEESVTLFQCPACGRFVSEDAASCVCGVRFASASETATCPECGSLVPSRDTVCPVCRSHLTGSRSDVMYQCPRCGTEVAEDAPRCACGARFAT